MAEDATDPDREPADDPALEAAFREYEGEVAVDNARRAAALAALFMLAGTLLDWIVFRDLAWDFLLIRMVTTLLLCGVFVALGRLANPLGRVAVAQLVALLPTLGICWMIALTGGGDSAYYAGLNLVLVGLSLLLRWTFLNSLVMIIACFVCYGVAVAAAPGSPSPMMLFNNSYFLFVTGTFVLAGSYFYERLRFREFVLRREVEEGREQLEQKNQQLSALDEAKTRFFANISHELRTPLTVIIGLNERLQQRLHDHPDETVGEMVGMVEHNGLRLLKLIDDLLDLVRFDTGHADLRLRPTVVSDMVDGLMRSMRHLSDQGGVALEWNAECPSGQLMLDRDKLEKVLLNLTINAIKFTPSGGRIDVTAEESDGELRLEVRDTGVGIPANVLPRIFERFWQVDSSSTRKFQGAGIGLALVNTLVEAMGGRIQAESEVGKGTAFIIHLPVEPAMVEAAPESADGAETGQHIEQMHRRAALAGARPPDHREPARNGRSVGTPAPAFPLRNDGTRPLVLVADDEPDMRAFLVMQLRDENAEVIEARDGAEAIELAKQRLPVLALIDHMMPEKDGVEVCREIRGNHGTREMPVVMLTARADENTKMTALEAGASDFLTKPFSSTELILRLRNQLAMARIRRELADLNRDLENALQQLKENEVLLIRNEKLSALGRMSAGIIHEINNPLNFSTAAIHALESFRRMLPEDEQEDYAEILGDIREGISRVSTIVADLRQFTRDDQVEGGPADLAETLRQARRMISHQLGSEVELSVEGPDEAPLSANGNQLVQVLVNLFQNAIDAVKQRLQDDPGEPGRIECRLRPAAGGWELTVRDNGVGIPPELVSKIYDPFYTSKDVGKGMGLGLSITHQIIERHRGHIEVESQPGKFTQFTLFFPPPDPEDEEAFEEADSPTVSTEP